jgi:hypothetical protein
MWYQLQFYVIFTSRTFWFFNIGKLIAFLPLPFILNEIEDKKSRLLPNAILQVVTIGVSAAAFVFGKVKYKRQLPQGNHAAFLVQVSRISNYLIGTDVCAGVRWVPF